MADYRAIAAKAAKQNGVDPRVFLAQISQESGFDPNARSGAGAIGIAQIVPRWHPGVDPHDPVASLYYAAHWMGQLLRKYGNYKQALSVYNSGDPNAYRDPAFAGGQTYHYVKTILGGANPAPSGAAIPSAVPSLDSFTRPAPQAQHGYAALLRQSLVSGDQMLGLTPTPSLTIRQSPTMQMQPPVATPGMKVPASPLPLVGKPSLKFIENFAQPFGLTVTSTTGGKHADHSFHYQSRAVDFGGAPGGMAALAKYALAHAGEFTEMFYTGPGHPGFFISRGKVLPLSQLDRGLYAEHENHVHLAR